MSDVYCPRLLCVEDVPDQVQHLVRRFTKPRPNEVEMYGLEGFAVDTALTAAEARARLAEATHSMRPYDVVLLDLGLPREAGDTFDPLVGLELLDALKKEFAFGAGAVVVHSSYQQVQYFVQLLRAGAADFVSKLDDLGTVFAAVVGTYRKSIEKDKNRWNERRRLDAERWLLAQASFFTIDRMARETTAAVARIQARIRGMPVAATAGCDTEISTLLAGLDAGLEDITLALARARLMPGGSNNRVEALAMSDAAVQAVSSLREDFYLRRVVTRLDVVDQANLRTFAPDLQLLLTECLLAALETANPGQVVAIQLTSHPGPRVAVSDVSPLSEGDARRIDREEAIWPHHGRIWRLAFIRQLARSLGGDMQLQSTTTGCRLEIQLPESIDG